MLVYMRRKAVEVMRLIDADKVLYMEHEDAMNHIEYGCDYDPDKVVEALEAEKDKHFFGTHDEEREVYCMGIDEAIEIVKKGGVE